jgi:hypothetical protein
MSLTHLIKRRRRFLVLAAPPGGQAGSQEGGYPALSLHFLPRFHLAKHNHNCWQAVKTIIKIMRKNRVEETAACLLLSFPSFLHPFI